MSQTAARNLIGLLVIAAASLPNLRAGKGPTDLLADQADAVVVGEVLSGQQTGHSVAFVLSISRAIKGGLPAGTTINVSGGVRGSGNGSLKGHYGLWFLKKTGSQWTFLPVIQAVALGTGSYAPLSRTTSPAAVNTPSPPVTTNDHIAVELVAALQSKTTPIQLYTLTWSFLGGGESALMPGLYRTLRFHPNPELRFIGVAGLMRGSENAAALAEIADNLHVIANLRTRSFVLTAISGARNTDPGAIQLLGKIASSPDADAQRCAAEALDFMHTRDTLPFLAALLDSNDARTREYAMRGLSRFVDSLPIPSIHNVLTGKDLIPQGPTPYRTPETDKYSLSRRSLGQADQTEYLLFWKSWWARMKDTVMGAPGPPVRPR